MTDTEAVLERHLSAFTEQNKSKTLESYTDESVVVTNFGTFTGRNGIEHLFDDLFADLSREGSSIDITQKTVKNQFAYVVWHAETPKHSYDFATDTYYIPGDEILFQTLTAKIVSNDA